MRYPIASVKKKKNSAIYYIDMPILINKVKLAKNVEK